MPSFTSTISADFQTTFTSGTHTCVPLQRLEMKVIDTYLRQNFHPLVSFSESSTGRSHSAWCNRCRCTCVLSTPRNGFFQTVRELMMSEQYSARGPQLSSEFLRVVVFQDGDHSGRSVLWDSDRTQGLRSQQTPWSLLMRHQGLPPMVAPLRCW